jgi:hypothetical protein
MGYFINGLTYHEKAGDKERQAKRLNSIVSIHRHEKRFEKSLQYFMWAVFSHIKATLLSKSR